MANVITSVANGGLADNLVKAAYDLALGEELHNIPSLRQFVTERSSNPSMQGSSITLNRSNFFSKASIDAAKTALGELVDVDSVNVPATTPVTLTPAERGFTVQETRLLHNRTFVDFDPSVANAVALHCSRVVDEVLQDKLVAGTTGVTPGGAAVNTLTNTNVLTSSLLRRGVAQLRNVNAPTQDGTFYAAVMHPYVILDLREEAGSGGWRVPHEYGTDQTELWKGEAYEYEGLRIMQYPLTRVTATGASSANVFNTYLLGRQALAEEFRVEPEIVISPVIDKLKRFQGIGWYADFDFAVYNPKAIQRIQTGSSLGASYVAE